MRLGYFILLLTIFFSCKQNNKKAADYNLHLRQTQMLSNLPGCSGITFYRDSLYLVSDNFPCITIIDTNNFSQTALCYTDDPNPVAKEKNVKEDFENFSEIEINKQTCLIAFGSGSKEKFREKILILNRGDHSKKKLLKAEKFYQNIREILKTDISNINIEGSFNIKDSFYLLNRGDNTMLGMSVSKLSQFLEDTLTKIPEISVRSFQLPKVENFPVAFSGACYYKQDLFLFTASAEKTNNWIADGDVIGSWIGIGKTDGTIITLLPLKDASGKALKVKLEGVTLIEEDEKGDIYLFAVADNDDNNSRLLRLKMLKN